MIEEAARPLGGGGGGGAGTTSDTGFLSRVSHGLRYGFSHGLSFAKRGMRASSDIRQRNGSGRAAGGSIREQGPEFFLKEEIAEARRSVKQLDEAVTKATSFREKSSHLLEDANRALSRLEQAIETRSAKELIVIACEIKVSARRGLTLVGVYGGMGAFKKLLLIPMRKSIRKKFDKVIDHLNRQLSAPVAQQQQQQQQLELKSVGPAARISNPTSLAMVSTTHRERDVVAPIQGKVLRPTQHDRVFSLVYDHSALVELNSICIWWSTGSMLEFYSDAYDSTTSFKMEKPALMSVTTVAIDQEDNVWTGHLKGTVRVRPKHKWEWKTEEQAFSTTIRAIAFDTDGRAWVGDDAGMVKVLYFDNEEGTLETVGTLLAGAGVKRPGTTSSNQLGSKADGGGGSSGGALGFFGRLAASERHTDGAVRSIFVSGQHGWVALGPSGRPKLTLWCTLTLRLLDSWDCGSFGHCHAMKALGPPRAVNTATLVAPSSGGTASDGEGDSSGMGSTWRLLTGHENGQLLLWHPDSKVLAPMISIGAPSSPVRGIMVFDEVSLVCVGHANGDLVGFARPNLGDTLSRAAALDAAPPLVPGSEHALPESFGMFSPKKFSIRAHRSNLTTMVGSGTSLVTVSGMGTIRLWYMNDLLQEAERQGVPLPSLGSKRAFSKRTQSRVRSHDDLKSLGTMNSNAGQQGLATCSAQHPAYARTSDADADSNAAGSSIAGPRGSGSEAAAPATAAAAAALFGGGMMPPGVGSHPAMFPFPSVASTITTAGGMTTTTSSGLPTPAMSVMTGVSSFMPSSVGGDLRSAGASMMGMATCQTIDFSELSLQRLIGSGAYGKVWLAEWTGCKVAVKELMGFGTSDNNDVKAWQEMQNEVCLLGSLSHPNIMRFMAISLDPPTIVMQYYEHGTLFGLLQRATKGDPRAVRELSWTKRLSMLRDVAAGMQYLHSRKPPVIHGDLRSPNLLLDMSLDDARGPRFHVKIADFGLARMMGNNSTQVMLSKTTNPRWTAPEVIRNSTIGTAGDVYSFAIIMWEMLTWQQPYEEMMSVQVIFSTANSDFRPDIPPDAELPGNPGCTLAEYKALMERCWSHTAASRPSFKQIVQDIGTLLGLEGGGQLHTRRGVAGGRGRGRSYPAVSVSLSGPSPGRGGGGAGGIAGPRSGGVTGEAEAGGNSGPGSGGSTLTRGCSNFSTHSEPVQPGYRLPSAELAAGLGGLGSGAAAGDPEDAEDGANGGYSQDGGYGPNGGSYYGGGGSYDQQGSGDGGGGDGGWGGDGGDDGALAPLQSAPMPGAGAQGRASYKRTGSQPMAGMAAIREEEGSSSSTKSQQAALGQGQGRGPGGRFLTTVSSRQSRFKAAAMAAAEGSAPDGAMAAAASPFSDAQPQAPSTSPFVGAQPQPATASPFSAAQPQAAPTSPFLAAQPQPAAAPASRFAADQPASTTNSPFAAAQPQGPPASPFLAAQAQAATNSASPFAAEQQQAPAGSSPFAADQAQPAHASTSPFAAAQPQPASNSPFAAAQPQPASNSPFAAAQPQPASNSPFAAAQPQPASNSPFAAAQPQPASNSPFAAAQTQPASNSPFAAAQQQPVSNSPFAAQPQPASNSPFAAAQQQPVSNSPFAAAQPQPTSNSPFAAAQQQPASNSPFAAAQPQPTSNSPFAAAQQQPASNSPFAAAQPQPASNSPFAAAQQQPASNSPFAAAQPQPESNSPFAAAQPQPASNSPFAAAQPQPESNSPFAAAQQQPASNSPFAAAQQQPASNSPFAAAQQQPASNSPFAAAQQQPASNSPFAAAQPQPTSNSPFAAAQQAASSTAPYLPAGAAAMGTGAATVATMAAAAANPSPPASSDGGSYVGAPRIGDGPCFPSFATEALHPSLLQPDAPQPSPPSGATDASNTSVTFLPGAIQLRDQGAGSGQQGSGSQQRSGAGAGGAAWSMASGGGAAALARVGSTHPGNGVHAPAFRVPKTTSPTGAGGAASGLSRKASGAVVAASAAAAGAGSAAPPERRGNLSASSSQRKMSPAAGLAASSPSSKTVALSGRTSSKALPGGLVVGAGAGGSSRSSPQRTASGFSSGSTGAAAASVDGVGPGRSAGGVTPRGERGQVAPRQSPAFGSSAARMT